LNVSLDFDGIPHSPEVIDGVGLLPGQLILKPFSSYFYFRIFKKKWTLLFWRSSRSSSLLKVEKIQIQLRGFISVL